MTDLDHLNILLSFLPLLFPGSDRISRSNPTNSEGRDPLSTTTQGKEQEEISEANPRKRETGQGSSRIESQGDRISITNQTMQ